MRMSPPGTTIEGVTESEARRYGVAAVVVDAVVIGIAPPVVVGPAAVVVVGACVVVGAEVVIAVV